MLSLELLPSKLKKHFEVSFRFVLCMLVRITTKYMTFAPVYSHKSQVNFPILLCFCFICLESKFSKTRITKPQATGCKEQRQANDIFNHSPTQQIQRPQDDMFLSPDIQQAGLKSRNTPPPH